eukprot:12240075-Alexandrium_andersonii.AAC.1
MHEYHLECCPACAAACFDELGHFLERHEYDRIICDNLPPLQQPSRDRAVQAKLLLDPTDLSTAALVWVAVGARAYHVQKNEALADFAGAARHAVRRFHM